MTPGAESERRPDAPLPGRAVVAAPVLVVEDEPRMRELVAAALRGDGHEVTAVGDGMAALLATRDRAHRAAVLDLGLPGMSGIELARHLRRERPDIGIVVLTARDSVEDRIRGLDGGADDYLVKPFATAELLARLRAVLRRLETGSGRLEVGPLVVDPAAVRAAVGGRALPLSVREFVLLRALAVRAGEVVERDVLLQEVWGGSGAYDGSILDQYVSYLRRKLAAAAPLVEVQTVRGVGYRLHVER